MCKEEGRLKIYHDTLVVEGEWGRMKWQVENDGGGNFINLIQADIYKGNDPDGFHIENEKDIDIMCEELKKLLKTEI